LRGESLGFALFTGILAVLANMAVGALAGTVAYHLWRWRFGRRS
jgi:hypothetical protein